MKRLLQRGVNAIRAAYTDAAGDASWLADCASRNVGRLRGESKYSGMSSASVYDAAYQDCFNRRFA